MPSRRRLVCGVLLLSLLCVGPVLLNAQEAQETCNGPYKGQRLSLEELAAVLTSHHKWQEQEPGGQQANLCEADLRGANLQKAGLLWANLQEADLRGANLQKADLVRANLQEARLEEANLQEASLVRADLRGARLRGANLREANLQEARLEEADLQEAGLQGANLQKADLAEANLQKADLVTAKLQEAKLQEAKLQEASLEGANLQEDPGRQRQPKGLSRLEVHDELEPRRLLDGQVGRLRAREDLGPVALKLRYHLISSIPLRHRDL